MGELFDRLTEYGNNDNYAFHMPGHKRQENLNFNPYKIDITEIDGFDNLHHPQGLLARLVDRIKKFYDCGYAWISVNGSTAGLLTAISALTEYGDEILVARNSHHATYHAIQIRGLHPIYLYPENQVCGEVNGVISVRDVLQKLEEHPEIKTVVLTSPTYEGICSDVGAIAKVVHEHGAKLIVDAAHGAHLKLGEIMEENSSDALAKGADVEVMSLHKTLPAVTQTAVLCANCDEETAERLQSYFDIYVTSSPSYLMMCSVEHCMDILEDPHMREIWEQYLQNLKEFYESVKDLKCICVPDQWKDEKDPGKILIFSNKSGWTGARLADELRNAYHLEVEMACADYILAMTSFCDSKEGLKRLSSALWEMDEKMQISHSCCPDCTNEKKRSPRIGKSEIAKVILTPAEAFEKKKEYLPMRDAVGRISGAYVYAYPPGIPILAPGEEVRQEVIREILDKRKAGVLVEGLEEDKICILK